MSASILGRELELDGVITKTCEKCDGSGRLQYTRDATLNELRDVQIKSLTEADIYRETDGQTEQNSQNNGPGGPTPSEARAQARNPHMGGTPNF